MNPPGYLLRSSLLATCVALAFCVTSVFPCFTARHCSLVVTPEHYVFEGVVRAIVAPMEPAYLAGPRWGLEIEVSSLRQAPHAPGRFVRVFPFDGYTASCNRLGYSLERIAADFPVGTTLRVAATAYPCSAKPTPSLPTRLYSDRLGIEPE